MRKCCLFNFESFPSLSHSRLSSLNLSSLLRADDRMLVVILALPIPGHESQIRIHVECGEGRSGCSLAAEVLRHIAFNRPLLPPRGRRPLVLIVVPRLLLAGCGRDEGVGSLVLNRAVVR